MSNYGWNNGRMIVSWVLLDQLEKLKIDLNDFEDIGLLIGHLSDLCFDHTSHGILDDTGVLIQNTINEIKRLND